MATGSNYPTSLDSVPNKVNGNKISIQETNRQMSAIEQLEQKVGITNSTDINSHEYKINSILNSGIYKTIPNFINAYTGSVVETLPTAVGNSGIEYLYKKIDSSENTVTINTLLGQTIDGQLEFTLTAENEIVRLMSNNSNWLISGRM